MHLGIDISKDSLDCFKLAEKSAKRFNNDARGIEALVAWLGADTDLHVVMEATGVYWQACAFALFEQGVKLSVVNPAQVKYFARSCLRRGKTDSMDAELLAHYAQKMQPGSQLLHSLQNSSCLSESAMISWLNLDSYITNCTPISIDATRRVRSWTY